MLCRPLASGTCVAGGTGAARDAAADEGVSVVGAGSSVAAGVGVALTLTCSKASWEMFSALNNAGSDQVYS